MIDLNHLLRSVKKGNYSVKLIKFFRFFKHSYYWAVRKKIGQFKHPPKEIIEIGFFDKRRYIHTSEEYYDLFPELNIYRTGLYHKMHPELIAIVKQGDRILIKKWFAGLLKYNKFYSELICNHKLRNEDITPKIHYVDYSECVVYMEYLEVDILSNLRRINRPVMFSVNLNNMINGFLHSMNILHEKGIVLYDMRDDNMLYGQGKYYFIDFADAVYENSLLKSYFARLKKNEKKKMINEIENCVKRYCESHLHVN